MTIPFQVVANEEEQKTKWCRKTESHDGLEASSRALASKARLHELENDMFERSERQAARDRRLANMRQVLADNEVDDIAIQALSLGKKHVSF